MTVGARLAVAACDAREARLDDDDEDGHAQRAAQHLQRRGHASARRARARPPGAGAATARRARRRRPRARPPRPTRTASAGSAGPACRPGRGPSALAGSASASGQRQRGGEGQPASHGWTSSSAICSPWSSSSTTKRPVDRRRERERAPSRPWPRPYGGRSRGRGSRRRCRRRLRKRIVSPLLKFSFLTPPCGLAFDDADGRRRAAPARRCVVPPVVGRARVGRTACRSTASTTSAAWPRAAMRVLLAVVAPAREDDVGHDEDDDRAHDDGQALEVRESGLLLHDREE